jgi:hypothetical protein
MTTCLVRSVNAVMLVVLVCSMAMAQTGQKKSTTSSAPHDPHDLTGVWLQKGGGGGANNHLSPWVEKSDPPLTPQGVQLMATHKPSEGPRTVMPALQNDPQSGGNPPGLIRTLIYGRPFEIAKLDDSIVMMFEWYHVWRQIWTDGRKVPSWDTVGPYWYGYSVGNFKGDEFEIQTVGMDNRAWMDNWGTPFSEAINLVEHWRRVDHDTLTVKLTINDPMIYAQPWTTKEVTYKYQPKGSPDGELFEVIFAPIDEKVFNDNVRDPGAYGSKTGDNAKAVAK